MSFDNEASFNQHHVLMRILIDHICLYVPPSYSAWPKLIPQELKMELLQSFRDQTSSDALCEKVYAACNYNIAMNCCIDVPLEDVNIELLKWPNCHIVDGCVVDNMWLHGTWIPPLFPQFEGCFQDVLVAFSSLISLKGIPCALQLCSFCC